MVAESIFVLLALFTYYWIEIFLYFLPKESVCDEAPGEHAIRKWT